MILEPVLTPHGVLTLGQTGEPLTLEPERGARLEQAFARGSGHGLLCLGADEVGTGSAAGAVVLARARGALRDRAVRASRYRRGRHASRLCPVPADGELDRMAAAVPPMTGAEYLTAAVLADLWHAMDAAFDAELARSQALRAGVPQEPSSGLEPGRARAFQPGREPEGRGRAVRVSGDLHDPAFGAGQGPASAARQGPAGICRRAGTASACCRC